jgi:hypothetical protein
MKVLSILFACFLIQKSYGQNYIISHDLQKEKTQYLKIGKHNDTVKVRDITVKKNARIILQVDNYNPFYWNAKVTAYKKPVDNQASSAGAFNPFSVLTQGLGNFVSSVLPKLDMPAAGQGLGAPSSNIKEVTSINFLYQKNYEKIKKLENKLNELENLKIQLTDLKFNLIKDEATIKADVVKSVTNVLGTSQLDFENIFPMGNGWDNSLHEAIDSTNLLQGLITKQSGAAATGQSPILIRNLNGKTLSIQQFSEDNPHIFLDKLNAVAVLYREIINTHYKFSYALNAELETSDLKLEIFPRADAERKDTIVKYFAVRGKGNFKLRNSMGIAFTYFADNNRSYFVDPNSGKIVKQNGDFFTPVLSTFIHFYGGGSSRFKWGGALGFGIPLQGAQKDINFMLGLSAVLGNNEPILITAGVSGAKVNKLDKGYKVGDVVSSSSFTIPVRSVYQPGLFLAVTFNLSSITGRRN